MSAGSDVERLQRLGRAFDQLLRSDPRVRPRVAAALGRYYELAERHRSSERQARAAVVRAVRDVLRAGWLRQHAPGYRGLWHARRIEWVFSDHWDLLAGARACARVARNPDDPSLERTQTRCGECCPIDTVEQLAAQALEGLENHEARQVRATEAAAEDGLREARERVRRGTHRSAAVDVFYCAPEEAFNVPKHPEAMRWDDLVQLPRADRLAVAYARLAGLRDTLSLDEPLTGPEPAVDAQDATTFDCYGDHCGLRAALPTEGENNQLVPDPGRLSPDIGDALMRLVESDLADESRQTYTPDSALALLARYPSWRLPELPGGITADLLRVLDADGLIEVRTWTLQNITTDPNDPKPLVPQPTWFGWNSTVAKPDVTGTLEALFEEARTDPRRAAEVRVSQRGRAELTKRSLAAATKPPEVVEVPEPSRPVSRSELLDWIVKELVSAQMAWMAYGHEGVSYATKDAGVTIQGARGDEYKVPIPDAKRIERRARVKAADLPPAERRVPLPVHVSNARVALETFIEWCAGIQPIGLPSLSNADATGASAAEPGNPDHLEISLTEPKISAESRSPVLQAVGEVYRVVFGVETGLFRRSRSLEQLEWILRCPHPADAILALDLMGTPAEAAAGSGSKQPVLDPQAARDCREELVQLEKDIAEARRCGQDDEVAQLEADKTELLKLAAAATGLHGKARSLGVQDPAEKARRAVAAGLKRLYERLRQAEPPLPGLADHLQKYVRPEGNGFAYRPPVDVG